MTRRPEAAAAQHITQIWHKKKGMQSRIKKNNVYIVQYFIRFDPRTLKQPNSDTLNRPFGCFTIDPTEKSIFHTLSPQHVETLSFTCCFPVS